VALVRTNDSEERIASIIRVTVFLHSILRLIVTAIVIPSSTILVTLMIEAIRSCEASVFTRAARRNIPEDIAFLRSMLQLLVTVNVLPISPIFVTLIMEAILSPETSVLTRVT
jgi:hypothetical protein